MKITDALSRNVFNTYTVRRGDYGIYDLDDIIM